MRFLPCQENQDYFSAKFFSRFLHSSIPQFYDPISKPVGKQIYDHTSRQSNNTSRNVSITTRLEPRNAAHITDHPKRNHTHHMKFQSFCCQNRRHFSFCLYLSAYDPNRFSFNRDTVPSCFFSPPQIPSQSYSHPPDLLFLKMKSNLFRRKIHIKFSDHSFKFCPYPTAPPGTMDANLFPSRVSHFQQNILPLKRR